MHKNHLQSSNYSSFPINTPLFFSCAPSNTFAEDEILQVVLRQYLPAEVYEDIKKDLVNFGRKCATSIARDGELCEIFLPKLIHVRPWGQKVDQILVHEAWKRLQDVSAVEGLIAIGYERKYKGNIYIY